MGLDAQVIAIGPFSADNASSLEYGEKRYVGVPAGATVVSTVFLVATTDESVALAAAFGVGAFEMGKHKLDPSSANIEALVAQFGEGDVGNFRRLASRGFEFFYMPNGYRLEHDPLVSRHRRIR